MGRRLGSGFTTMWDGRPPCDTMVGESEDGGKGTKVRRPLEDGRSRRKCDEGMESSHSMDGSKKGRRPAKWFGPSQVVMKCTTLSVVHDVGTKKQEQEKAGMGRDLSQDAARRNLRQHENEGTRKRQKAKPTKKKGKGKGKQEK